MISDLDMEVVTRVILPILPNARLRKMDTSTTLGVPIEDHIWVSFKHHSDHQHDTILIYPKGQIWELFATNLRRASVRMSDPDSLEKFSAAVRTFLKR